MKTIKNIFMAIAFLAIAIACDPLEDVYAELEEAETDAGTTINYTLVADDYASIASTMRANAQNESDSSNADFVEDNEAFSTDIQAKDFVETFVNMKYPQFGAGVAVKITYSFFNGDSPDYGVYLNAEDYEMDADDYATVDGNDSNAEYLDANADVNTLANTLLLSNLQSANDGDVASFSYDYISVAYADLSGETAFTETFPTTLGDFESISITGDQAWFWDDFSSDTFAKMSGYASGAQPNVDWLVSPEIDLTAAEGDITLNFTQILNFQGAAEWGTHLDVRFSTNYTGDVSTATWTSVGANLDVYPDGNNYDSFASSVALDGAKGETIHIAYFYESTSDFASLWEILDLTVEIGAAPTVHSANTFYEFDGGSWTTLDGVFYLGSEDYDGMGENSGQPGRFNNFSADTPSNDYLPEFLKNNVSFPQEGDMYDVVFRYYNGSFTETLAETYSFTSGQWTGSFYVNMTDQYVHDGSEFVFDPSVEFTMSGSDYQIIVDQVAASSNSDLVNSFGTGEDYYGADSFYANFDLRLSSREGQADFDGLSGDEATALTISRMGEGIEVMLEAKFSDAAPVQGLEVFYTVESKVYDGNDKFFSTKFELTAVGEFELVEGPTQL